MGITPEQMLDMVQHLERELKKAKSLNVKVGLPKEKTTRKIYPNGKSVLEVGVFDEYGEGVMLRSFLRVPHTIKRNQMAAQIDKQFSRVLYNGIDVESALEVVGIEARNISVAAFTNEGYGTWADISEETKARKGSSQILVDTGILRGSITWVVTDGTS